MLVYVRPSNEALLRARVPGAQDHMGPFQSLFIVGALRAQRPCRLPRCFPSKLARFSLGIGAD